MKTKQAKTTRAFTRLLAVTLLLIFMCSIFSGCSAYKKSLLTSGRWLCDGEDDVYYEFYDDGTYFYSVSWNGILFHEEEGEWTIEGDIVTKHPYEENLKDVEFELSTSDKTLTRTDGEDDIFYLEED